MSVFTNPATGAAEHASAYTSAVLELLGDREPGAVLRETPLALPRAVERLSPQQMRGPERPGKWSIGQILQHLADSEVVWAWRMRLILAQAAPPPDRARSPRRRMTRSTFVARGPGVYGPTNISFVAVLKHTGVRYSTSIVLVFGSTSRIAVAAR